MSVLHLGHFLKVTTFKYVEREIYLNEDIAIFVPTCLTLMNVCREEEVRKKEDRIDEGKAIF